MTNYFFLYRNPFIRTDDSCDEKKGYQAPCRHTAKKTDILSIQDVTVSLTIGRRVLVLYTLEGMVTKGGDNYGDQNAASYQV